MVENHRINTNIKRGALLFTLAAASACAPLQKINEGLCFGGRYAPQGSSASFDTDENVELITLRRQVEVIPDPDGQTYKNYSVKVGDTVFLPSTGMRAGEWEKITASNSEVVSDYLPIVINSINPQPDRPYGKEIVSCVDKYRNVHIK